MSKTGKLLLIFGLTAFVSLIAFGVSIAILGVSNGNYSVSLFGANIPFMHFGGRSEVQFNNGGTVYTFDSEPGRSYDMTFDASALTGIDIETASAHTTVTCGDTDEVYVKYTVGDARFRFTAELINGKFTALEHSTGFFSFGSFNAAELEIKLPEKMYNNARVAVASGITKVNGLTSDSMNCDLASGDLEMNIYAKKIRFSAASGHGVFRNCTENACEEITVQTASGGQEFYGFGSDNTNIDIASGNVKMQGLSGKVDVDIASGKVELLYAEWNGGLDIDVMSGKADITLPAGSGIDLEFDRASGGMDINLDGTGESFHKDAEGIYGGSNVHEANIDVASGNVSIHN